MIEEADERILAAQFLDVQRDGGVRIGSKQGEEIFGRGFMRRRFGVVRNVEPAVGVTADIGLDPPPAIERRADRREPVFGRRARAHEISAMRKNDRHVSPVRGAASHLPPS